MYTSPFFLAMGLHIASPLVSTRGLISTATGDLGGNSTGLGGIPGGVNSQADVTIFKSGAGALREITDGGNIVVASALVVQQKLTGNFIPSTPIELDRSRAQSRLTPRAKKLIVIAVTKNVPDTNGKGNAANHEFPIVATIPAGTTCTGTVGALKSACAVNCANPAGPLDGTVLVQQDAAKKRAIAGK